MGFKEDLQIETVDRLPLREVIIVNTGTIVRAAVARMRNLGVGCAVVVDFLGNPVGVFTESSVINVLTQGVSMDETAVGRFTERKFRIVSTSNPISHVWEAIQRDGVRYIGVTNENGKLIGLTGQRGLAEYVAEYFAAQVTVQRIGGTPWMQYQEGA